MYQSSYHDPFLSPASDHHHNLHAFQPSSSSFHQHGSINLQKEQFFNPNPPYPFLQRSSSFISLHQTNGQHSHGHHGMFERQQLDQLSFNSQATIGVGVGSMRKVFSTGDIQAFSQHVLPESMQQQPANSGENSCQELGGGVMAAAGRVGRYSAEERRERIERYRNKRNQRNFHKKITYACRKTLADRRPRVHGRFARNEEPEVEIINAEAAESVLHGDWGFQTEAAAMTMMAVENDNYYCYDGEFWNDFADVYSTN